MPDYHISFLTSAAREFRSLPKEVKRRIAAVIDNLQSDARPPGVRKLQGQNYLYRIRVGDYRIVYELDERQKSILVTTVRHRKDVYR